MSQIRPGSDRRGCWPQLEGGTQWLIMETKSGNQRQASATMLIMGQKKVYRDPDHVEKCGFLHGVKLVSNDIQ